MIPLQSELWPFSSYPMFNVRFDAPDETIFELVAVNSKGTISAPISDQRVLGAVRNGYLSRYCRAKIKMNDRECLQSSLQYWVKRYQQFESRLPPELHGFSELKLVETLSKSEIGSAKIERNPL